MPELPEVLTVAKELNNSILGLAVTNCSVSSQKLRESIPDLSILVGKTINKIVRLNKFIIIEISEFTLLIHLGMTGQILVDKLEKQKHQHLTLELSNGNIFRYVDTRRFGLIKLYNGKIEENIDIIKYNYHIGLDPVCDTLVFNTIKTLYNRKRPIKNLLMDNSLICGIGNIYATEILFESRIHPTKTGDTLTESEINSLIKNIIIVLNKAILLGGSSINDYIKIDGTKGSMQNYYNAYGRFGKECKLCSTKIDKIKQSGRTTFYCPTCQKLG